MVRRYKDLVQEIKEKQRFSRVDWTKKIIAALQYTIEEAEESGENPELVTYEEWREWQEAVAKKFGFSEPTDTTPDKTLRNHGWRKVRTTTE